ncbi:unnamed protein product [Microthlaspi erraticum]|uniref:Bromo domain-containing protein n=1 Tax=Microthlaspi erraticum TaxID=1685480 RepID=A0A6D2I7P2_9BRAS|nr:unnamed protein product [Microthlaspi erraticum]
MSQIARRRRKGPPSNADLGRRMSSSPGESRYELRRGQSRRNVSYNFDFYDYLDEEEEIEDEEEKKRQKKLKHVLNLNQSRARADPPTSSPGRAAARVNERGGAEEIDDESEADQGEEEEEEDASEKRQVKKRKINRREDEDEKDYDEAEEDEEDDDHADSDEDNDKERKKSASGSGTSSDSTPILDKKSLELILDKLQKKDIYGVYAEPVDPEELPDYHDMIEHPMDFSTVRKKLANGSYPTLEELESDVLLICSNAMEYNSSDTVYYKHAKTIQEMGKRKFEKARIKIKRAEKELKTHEKAKPGSSGEKQVRQQLSRNGLLEPVTSDLSSGAKLTSGGALQNEPLSTQTGGHNIDVLFEGNTSLINNLEKAEELSSGKDLVSKCGRKLSVVEEDRRATYGSSDQQTDRSESIFTTFESEIKEFVPVGLHAEHAYGRSLARFAATLGPAAWKIASQRIEQSLPADFKFGRGWVGEYEPLPTPVLVFETCLPKESPKEASMFWKPQSNVAAAKKNEALFKTPVPAEEQQCYRPARDGNRAVPFPTSIGAVSERSVATQVGNLKSMSQHEYRNPPPVDFVKPQNRIPQQVELNLPPPAEQTSSGDLSFGKPDTLASSYRSSNDMMRNMTPTDSERYNHHMTVNGNFPGGLSNGRVSSGVNNRMFEVSSAKGTQQPMRQQSQSHVGQAQLMSNFNENARTQHNTNAQLDVSSPKSARSEDSSNASAAAARAWMSIGNNNKQTSSQISAESLYNPSREQLYHQAFKPKVPEGTHFFPQRNGLPFQTFVHQPVHGMMMNGGPPNVFPQMAAPTSDYTRFHVQSPWQGGVTPYVQLNQRRENLNFPPDLNIGVHSPDSPARHSQQPDLALQL